jgi:DNA-binding Lrp family transcriptional regulator
MLKKLKHFEPCFLLECIYRGKTEVDIAHELSVTLPDISYHFRKLKDKGLIEKIAYSVWALTKRGERKLETGRQSVILLNFGMKFLLNQAIYVPDLREDKNLPNISTQRGNILGFNVIISEKTLTATVPNIRGFNLVDASGKLQYKMLEIKRYFEERFIPLQLTPIEFIKGDMLPSDLMPFASFMLEKVGVRIKSPTIDIDKSVTGTGEVEFKSFDTASNWAVLSKLDDIHNDVKEIKYRPKFVAYEKEQREKFVLTTSTLTNDIAQMISK